MKRLLVGIVTGCIILVACAAPVEQTDAKSKDIWEVIGTQEIEGETFIEVRHIKSGCHYAYTRYGKIETATAMLVEDASSGTAPYCTYNE